ncbi:CLUMA_CG003242, isoform A [Clunio marinus]|uniref:CLUMA_CG003242, isoform A n=1 Tax=Clunio marinus TaxID=568069 RepID=A0A1J1HPX0_9DIPT|nr:CLUMA_CG003242, isoform A [Clunio marinus]
MTMFQFKHINRHRGSVNMSLFLLLRIMLVTFPVVTGKYHTSGSSSQEKQAQRFAMEPQDQTAIIGSRVTLPCRVIDKTGLIQWTKDDFGLGVHRNLSGFERYSMVGSDEEGDFSLDISPIMLDDDARYQCQVSPGADGAPAIRSRYAKVTVLVPPDDPKIVKGNTSIDHMVATEDREIELECLSWGGKPAAEITWIDGMGNVLTSGVEYIKKPMADKKRFEAKSILKLIPKMTHHNTTISCQAQNTADRTEKIVRLKLEVKFAPKVTVSVISGALANEKIPEGAEIRLACHAVANPNELTYRWFINGEPAIGDYTTEIIIHNISRKYHDAIVKCEVQNAVGKSEESETLDISYGPTFQSQLKSVETDEGNTITLSCDVDGNPTPEIEWIFNPSGKVVGTTPNLTISVSNDHVGSYTCRASVMGISIEDEANIYLKGPPSITSTKKQFGIPGETVQIECVAFSIPKPRHILWAFNGREINNNQDDGDYTVLEEVTTFGMKSTLVLRESASKHFGIYNCSVQNDYGHDNVEIVLTGRHDSQRTYAFILLAVVLFMFMVVMISVICFKSGKKKLPPADVIPEHHINEKAFKDGDRYSNSSQLKDPDYSEYSGTESTATRMAINILGNGHGGVPLAGPVKIPNDQRYSGDYTDMHVAQKIGLTNNGYIPYNDYTRNYSSPNNTRTSNTNLKNHLITSSGQSPMTMNGSIDHYSFGRSRELRQDNGLPSIPLNTMPNGILSKYYTIGRRCCRDSIKEQYLTQTTSILDQSLLNNVDIRYSATYGNPFLKSSSVTPLPLPPNSQKPFTANPSVTPAPPPYNRSNNSNSSFSSSTTISNNGSLLGANHLGLSLPIPNSNNSSTTVTTTTATNNNNNNLTKITSPSRQFILPANGDLKKGSLATHV